VLLGESSVFSSGGPGKGMHCSLSRLLSETGFISSLKVHNQVFSDGGLFGIEATSLQNKYSEHTLEAISGHLINLLESLRNEDVQRAKNLTKINVEQTLERSRTRLEDNLRSLLL